MRGCAARLPREFWPFRFNLENKSHLGVNEPCSTGANVAATLKSCGAVRTSWQPRSTALSHTSLRHRGSAPQPRAAGGWDIPTPVISGWRFPSVLCRVDLGGYLAPERRQRILPRVSKASCLSAAWSEVRSVGLVLIPRLFYFWRVSAGLLVRRS